MSVNIPDFLAKPDKTGLKSGLLLIGSKVINMHTYGKNRAGRRSRVWFKIVSFLFS
jgi:hypothetical protein